MAAEAVDAAHPAGIDFLVANAGIAKVKQDENTPDIELCAALSAHASRYATRALVTRLTLVRFVRQARVSGTKSHSLPHTFNTVRRADQSHGRLQVS